MFRGTLFETQIPAAEFLCNRKRYLLAHEQGTGKTVIALAASEKLLELERANNVLVMAPTALAFQWADKLEEFTDTPYSFAEAKRKETRTYEQPGGPFYQIVPYSLVRRDFETLNQYKWDIIIADEAQELKNNTTKIARLTKRINAQSKPAYRWALTGTVISTKLEELYSVMYWVDPGFLPPWPVFEATHIVRNNLGIIERYKNLDSLHKYMTKRMDRKTHADQKGKIPKVLPQIHTIEPSKAYLAAEKSLVGLLDKMAGDLRFDEEGNLLGVRRDSKIAKVFTEARRSLLESKQQYCVGLCRRILEENPRNKIVLFSFYKDPLKELNATFGSESVLFTGDIETSERRDNIRRFSASFGPRILLASNAGAAGLDLPTANYVIHLDIPFSYAVMDQRTKRITRLSSKFSHVVAIYLMVSYSLDTYYYQLVKNREQLALASTEGGIDEVTVRPESLRAYLGKEDRPVLRPKSRLQASGRTTSKAKRRNKARDSKGH